MIRILSPMFFILLFLPSGLKAANRDLDWTLPLKTLDGKSESLNPFKGNILIINFWATWCGPCREEMPDFERFHHDYHKKNVSLIGVSVDTSSKDVINFLKKLKITYPIYRDGPNGPWSKQYSGFPFLPMTVIYDTQGRHIKTLIGPHTYTDLEKIIRPLIKEKREHDKVLTES